jgi:hypothetical protein
VQKSVRHRKVWRREVERREVERREVERRERREIERREIERRETISFLGNPVNICKNTQHYKINNSCRY